MMTSSLMHNKSDLHLRNQVKTARNCSNTKADDRKIFENETNQHKIDKRSTIIIFKNQSFGAKRKSQMNKILFFSSFFKFCSRTFATLKTTTERNFPISNFERQTKELFLTILKNLKVCSRLLPMVECLKKF